MDAITIEIVRRNKLMILVGGDVDGLHVKRRQWMVM
jgi:hypothetical protein